MISTVVTLNDLLSLKTVPTSYSTVSNNHKILEKKIIFCWHLRATEEKNRIRSQILNPVYVSENPDPGSWICLKILRLLCGENSKDRKSRTWAPLTKQLTSVFFREQ